LDAGSQTPARDAVVLGIDHVPVAVRDLEAVASRYRAMGFALKAGRPHTNGIRNQHVKFPEGTEIELITAPAAVDPLTREYRKHLEAGDGPAFLSLFAPSPDTLMRVIASAGFRARSANGLVTLDDDGPLPYLFFGSRQASPTDRPEHFAHPNTAYALTRVWLAADDLGAERRLLTALGARFRDQTVSVPEPVAATVAELPEGSLLLLPGNRQIVPGRRLVGITVAVRDLTTTTRILGSRAARVHNAEERRVFVHPDDTAGYWLEFHQPGGG
jgi:hypothetical protein